MISLLVRLLIIISALYSLGCTSLFFQPLQRHVYNPASFGLTATDIYIPVNDSVALHSWWFVAQPPVLGTVLYLHGNAENISTHFMNIGWLPEYGFNVLALDYRGYGKSSGDSDLVGIHEDVIYTLHYLQHELSIPVNKTIVLGQSLGGSVAISALSMYSEKDNLAGLITEGAFADYRRIVKEKLAEYWLTEPLQGLLSLTINNNYSPFNAISKLQIPIVIVHGKSDSVVPWQHAVDLASNSSSLKKLWLVDHLPHNQFMKSTIHREQLLAIMHTMTNSKVQ